MNATIHAGPGGQPAVTYQVLEGRLIEGHDRHAAAVGRSDDGIHLMLTPDAAAALAEILLQFPKLLGLEDGDYVPLPPDMRLVDSELWPHVAVDLLAARALSRGADALGQDVVYARAFESGYLQPRTRLRDLEVLDVAPPPDPIHESVALRVFGLAEGQS